MMAVAGPGAHLLGHSFGALATLAYARRHGLSGGTLIAYEPPLAVQGPVAGERLPPEAFDELDAILDDLRSREDEIPQWEFCEGFMAAVICNRRPLPPAEYLPMLLGDGITAEDRIVLDGRQNLRPGAKVRIITPADGKK